MGAAMLPHGMNEDSAMTKKYVEKAEGTGDLTGRIIFTFDDETQEVFDVANVDEKTRFQAMMHGFSQKIGDSYANAAKADNPLTFTKESARDTIAQMYAGDWRAARAAGEPQVSDLAVALSRASGQSIEAAHEFVEGLTDDEKKVWRKKAKIASQLDLIRSERLAERAKKLAARAASAEDADEDISFG